jgi:dihydrofolate reductase
MGAAVATAKEIAGDKNVGVNGGQMARQCLDAGLLDDVHVDLVPVLLGGGTPFFSELGTKPVQLDGPTKAVEGTGVSHITYAVRKNSRLSWAARPHEGGGSATTASSART